MRGSNGRPQPIAGNRVQKRNFGLSGGPLLTVALALVFTVPAWTVDVPVYSQPPNDAGGLLASSWVDPDGSDSDMYAYDSFVLAENAAITEVQWRGGYAYGAQYGSVQTFTIAFFESTAGGTEPLVTNPEFPEPYLVRYSIPNAAGETPVGIVGGVAMYDYHYVLPTAFQATAGEKYWIRIEGAQSTYPDWGIAKGTGGNGAHFRFSTGMAMYQSVPGDAAFTLLGAAAPGVSITASASPPEGGEILGAGDYPEGSNAALDATANPGFAFDRWTEGDVTVSTSAHYAFTANADRDLVAVFVPAYLITTSASPAYGGTTSGDGEYASGQSVTVEAMANDGYAFVEWQEFGGAVSPDASYTFTAEAARDLVAIFSATPTTATFDFDSGSPALSRGQSVAFAQTVNGITAHFGPDAMSAFSLQGDSNLFYHMSQFSGLYIWPNSVFRNTLIITFDQPILSISFPFASIDYQDNAEVPSNVQITAYATAGSEAPLGSAAAHGTYAGDTYPMGVLAYDGGGQTFQRVVITVPWTPNGTTNFLLDNITVVAQALASIDDPNTVEADQDKDQMLSLNELLRTIQFFNAGAFSCATGTEDGYQPGAGPQDCDPYDSDYNPQDWQLALSELLRLVQFYNLGGYYPCSDPASEDGFCAGVSG